MNLTDLKDNKMKILTVGDIHLYHEHTKIGNTIKSLLNTIKHQQIDMLVINGDFTHRVIPPLTDSYHLFITVVNEIILYCSTNNIILRVVDGTNSHDMGQLQIFETIIKSLGINIDFKYLSKITYEENKIGKMLYVPDNVGSNTIALDQVKKLMVEHEIGKFDFIFIHCMFDFQTPVQSIESFDSEAWIKLCDKYILNNHVHNHQRYKNIIAVGSFDRLTFGDDVPKGCVVVETVGLSYMFIQNKDAQVYLTYVDIHDDAELRALLKKSNMIGSFLKIKTNRPDYISSKLKAYHIQYYKIESVHVKKVKEQQEIRDTVKLNKATVLTEMSLITKIDIATIKKYLKG